MTQLVKLLKEFPRAEPTARDHTATIAFKKCPRYYFLRMVIGYKELKDARYFVFGSAYHKFREIYDNQIKLGNSTNDAQNVAFEKAKKVWEKGGGNAAVAPQDKYAFLSWQRLVLSCIEAAKKSETDKAHGRLNILHTELDFAIEVVNPDNQSQKMLISGKMDRLDKINGKVWVRDHKTSSKQPQFYERGLSPNDQATRYVFAANVLAGWNYLDPLAIPPVQGIIYEVLFNTKTTGPKIEQYTATRTVSQLQNWVRDQFAVEDMVARCRETDNWPMFETQCGFCIFHDVCRSNNEMAMSMKLKGYFKHEPWDSQNRTTDED